MFTTHEVPDYMYLENDNGHFWLMLHDIGKTEANLKSTDMLIESSLSICGFLKVRQVENKF